MLNFRRKTIRSASNPLDKCTVVSIYPKEVKEHKPTIQPGYFLIPKGSFDKPSTLIVGPSSWWREIDEFQPLLEITHSSIQVASALINDYTLGMLGVRGNDKPGLFFVPGVYTSNEIKNDFKKELESTKLRQINHYQNLIKMADAGWAKTNGNPLCISDDMRMAADQLNMKNKDWMADFQHMEMIRCIACGSMRNPLYPMCNHCHTIVDTELAKKLGLIIPSVVSNQSLVNTQAQKAG